MVNAQMHEWGTTRSVIREIFEYGNRRKAEIGADKVYDFSLGNPSVPAPQIVTDAIKDILAEMDPAVLHGYTSAQGDAGVRKALADNLNERFGTSFKADNLYVTVGAAAALMSAIRGLCQADDEFIAISPFFPEYRVFVQACGGKLVVVEAEKPSFQIDIDAMAQAITPKTKAVIINSPNNPCGVVYTEATITALADLLRKKSAEYGKPIFLIADEPYRELVYDDATQVPYVTKYYDDTIVCYSFSKSLSLPGERIGYVLVSDQVTSSKDVYAAVCGAGRALGYVCAPSLFQRVAARCAGKTADISVYKKNRDLLYNALSSMGFDCVYPDGAFYLFVKAMESDANAFCEKAKKYELLLVPGDDFGCPGYVRISYCVSTQMIENSLPAFEKLAKEYK